MNLRKSKRKRGTILSPLGWQKFQNARLKSENEENYGQKYTFEDLSDRTRLTPVTLRKVLGCEEGVDKRTLIHLFRAFNLELNENDYSSPEPDFERIERRRVPKRQDWGEAICVSVFYGRTEELVKLEQWIINDRCRKVAILGMGGIGKTSLSVKLAKHIEDKFEYLQWISLRDAPPIKAILAQMIQFLSNEEETETDLPESVGERVSRLIGYLQSSRCLLILDNAESILCSGSRAGQYRDGYEGYGELLKRVGEIPHESCLVLTSREKPKDLVPLEGKGLLVRSLQLSGLNPAEGEKIFKIKGLHGSEDELRALVERYAGNALALKIVATTIQDLFDGSVSEFLKHNTVVFGDIRELLKQQFERLCDLEQEVMYWLAINREPVSLLESRENIVSPIPEAKLLEALESLGRRCLIEKTAALFTLQPVVMEYVTERLVAKVCLEIWLEKIVFLNSHALMKAQGKDYVQNTQVRLILKPLIDELFAVFRSKVNLEQQLNKILATLQETSPLEPGYTAGNIINLLRHLGTDLKGYDFSNLSVWQADLRNVKLHDVNFQNANLAKSVFADTFGGVLSVIFSPDGKFFAFGDTKGEIHLRQVADGRQVFICKGHTSWVSSLAFSPDGRIFASGSVDFTVKLWDVEAGQCLQLLQGHNNEVWSVAFSPNGSTLVSGSDDRTVKLWNVSTGECLKTFKGHTSWVHSVGFSPNGQMLVSGSEDQTVKLWNISTGDCLKTLQGHRDGIRAIAINPDGQMLASSSEDQTVKLWDISTGDCLKTFQGHSNEIYSVAFSPQGNLLASGSHDQTVKLWDISTGDCLKTFQGHSSWVYSVAFSPQGDILASGSYDQTARLWSVHTNQCLRRFQGYTNQVLSVAFSPDGQMLASGSHDSSVRLWDVSTGQALETFQGHRAAVWSVAFSPDGQTLASSSEDRTVRLWNANTGQCLHIFQGHHALVWSVAFSPDGQTLASSSEDQTVRLWDVKTSQVLRTLQGHRAAVWSVAFSPDGQTLASGSHDQTVKLWDVGTGKCKKTLAGHTAWVWSVAFSPDSKLLASTSPDGTIRLWSVDTNECLKVLQVNTDWLQLVVFSPDSRTLGGCSRELTVQLWDINTCQCLKTLQGHTGRVWSVAFNPDSRTLVSGGEDETIRLWDVTTGNCSKTLKTEKPYERMNIKRVTGLTTATIATLKVLGAVD
jgi:WD40 repeat protein